MSRAALTLKALGERIARLPRAVAEPHLGAPGAARGPAAGGRGAAGADLSRRRRARAGAPRRPLAGARAARWRPRGARSGPRRLPDRRLEAERQACLWLDDLAALGNRPARGLAQAWVQDWINRFGAGGGPGWEPEAAGRRAKRWAVHAALLTQGLDQGGADRFWRALAAHQRYLARAWPQAAEGLPRLRALAGLVWSGVVLPHAGHAAALAEMAALADALVDADGGTPVAGAGGSGRGADAAHLDRAAPRQRRAAGDGAAPAGDRPRGAGDPAAAPRRRRGGALPRRRGGRRPSGSTRRWPSCAWSRSRSRGCPWASRGWPAGGWWC